MSDRDDDPALEREAAELRRRIASVETEIAREKARPNRSAPAPQSALARWRPALETSLGCLLLLALALVVLAILFPFYLLRGPG